MITLTQGSKEYLAVDINDEFKSITTLDGSAPKYDVFTKDGGNKMINQDPVVSAMQLRCMIDTTVGGTWTEGEYWLYVKFNALPEVPRLGPFKFRVSNDGS